MKGGSLPQMPDAGPSGPAAASFPASADCRAWAAAPFKGLPGLGKKK